MIRCVRALTLATVAGVLVWSPISVGADFPPPNYPGTWQLLDPTRFDLDFLYLKIDADVAHFELCDSHQCGSAGGIGRIERHEDLLILKYSVNGKVTVKIVLGGYETNQAVMFGTRFHYSVTGIINGLPLVYRRMDND